jgi:tetratricopeptide (TPR) repeat protein
MRGEMRTLRRVAAGAVVVLASLTLGHSALAQGSAYGLDNKHAAQELAQKALDCLLKGENARTRDEKYAAYSEGLALAKRAVEADDTNADAHFAVFGNNGRLMLLNGTTPNPISLFQASMELEKTLELNPNHADALAARGGLYRQLPWVLGGNLDKAEQYLTRAIELNPAAVGSRIELARTYRDKGTPERGRPLLEQAVRLAEEQDRKPELEQAQELLRDLPTR